MIRLEQILVHVRSGRALPLFSPHTPPLTEISWNYLENKNNGHEYKDDLVDMLNQLKENLCQQTNTQIKLSNDIDEFLGKYKFSKGDN